MVQVAWSTSNLKVYTARDGSATVCESCCAEDGGFVVSPSACSVCDGLGFNTPKYAYGNLSGVLPIGTSSGDWSQINRLYTGLQTGTDVWGEENSCYWEDIYTGLDEFALLRDGHWWRYDGLWFFVAKSNVNNCFTYDWGARVMFHNSPTSYGAEWDNNIILCWNHDSPEEDCMATNLTNLLWSQASYLTEGSFVLSH